jgi:hypothetical protein
MITQIPFKLTPLLIALTALLAVIAWVACGPSAAPVLTAAPNNTPTPTLTPVPAMSPQSSRPAQEGIPPGRSSEIIRVKFLAGTDVDPPEDALPPGLRNQVDSIRPLIASLSKEELEKIGADELKLWFEIKLKPDTDAAQFMEDLSKLDSVEEAHFAPLPAPPPR